LFWASDLSLFASTPQIREVFNFVCAGLRKCARHLRIYQSCQLSRRQNQQILRSNCLTVSLSLLAVRRALDRYALYRAQCIVGLFSPDPQLSIKASAEAFARYAKGNAHIIICGRNEGAAQEIFAKLPRTASSRYEFLQCDASRMANVTAACKRLKEEQGLTKLNYLFMRSVMFFTGSTSFRFPHFDVMCDCAHQSGILQHVWQF
jgi:hypothetical protein